MSTALVTNSMTATGATALPSAGDDLSGYLAKIATFDILDADKEQDLARRLRDEEDLDAARQLVMSQLRFVVHIARTYKGYGLPLSDLIQEGNIGLMKAVKRFDPDHGVRLISFAVHWIRAEIHEYVIRNWRIVKVATTKAQRKLFFKLRSSKKQLSWFNEAEIQAVAKDLGVEPSIVVEMESRLSGTDVAFDAPDNAREDRSLAPADILAQENADPSMLLERHDGHDQSMQQLAEGMEALDDRSREIISRRWLADDKATLHELAAEYNVSAERIRQIEKAAMGKLKKSLLSAA